MRKKTKEEKKELDDRYNALFNAVNDKLIELKETLEKLKINLKTFLEDERRN